MIDIQEVKAEEKVLRIGVNSKEAMQKRTIDIASGAMKPCEHDPKVWVTTQALAQLDSMADTIHLLGNKTNREHLAKSIAQLKEGKAKRREPIDAEDDTV